MKSTQQFLILLFKLITIFNIIIVVHLTKKHHTLKLIHFINVYRAFETKRSMVIHFTFNMLTENSILNLGNNSYGICNCNVDHLRPVDMVAYDEFALTLILNVHVNGIAFACIFKCYSYRVL